MASQLSAPVGSPQEQRRTGKSSAVLVAVGVIGIAVLAVAGGWLYVRAAGQDTTGLEGTWVLGDGRHVYEFRRSGELACWTNSNKEWYSRLGWVATWRRDGQKITIVTDRNWDFKGELDGDTIRGTMLMKDPAGAVTEELEGMRWRRGVKGQE